MSDLPHDRCSRCKRRFSDADPHARDWNVTYLDGRAMGLLCPACQTPGESAEAQANLVTHPPARMTEITELRIVDAGTMRGIADVAEAFAPTEEWIVDELAYVLVMAGTSGANVIAMCLRGFVRKLSTVEDRQGGAPLVELGQAEGAEGVAVVVEVAGATWMGLPRAYVAGDFTRAAVDLVQSYFASLERS